MQNNLVETVVGAAVIGVAALFGYYAFSTADAGSRSGLRSWGLHRPVSTAHATDDAIARQIETALNSNNHKPRQPDVSTEPTERLALEAAARTTRGAAVTIGSPDPRRPT